MEKPIELSDAECAAVAGGLFNNISVFVNTGEIEKSFNTNSFDSHSFNQWKSNNTLWSNNHNTSV
jgi:hypothetical protein